MADANTTAAPKDVACASDAERRHGAKECITALMSLEKSAENLPPAANYAAIHAAIQSGDAEYLVSLFGPMTPRQEGAFRTLAEYIHFSITAGHPNLEAWTPFVAQTHEEIAEWANSVFDEEVAA